ncbi:hypothetical protein [Erwinia sp.]|uniref:hypothetical protein n=1 Tax=Erwinia citreus TaxID=558 RepID=UPI003C778E35
MFSIGSAVMLRMVFDEPEADQEDDEQLSLTYEKIYIRPHLKPVMQPLQAFTLFSGWRSSLSGKGTISQLRG